MATLYESISLASLDNWVFMLQYDWLNPYPTSSHAGGFGVVGHDLDWSRCPRRTGWSLSTGSDSAIC